jgi:hypothetical protein
VDVEQLPFTGDLLSLEKTFACTMQRRGRNAARNEGFSETDSPRALIVSTRRTRRAVLIRRTLPAANNAKAVPQSCCRTESTAVRIHPSGRQRLVAVEPRGLYQARDRSGALARAQATGEQQPALPPMPTSCSMSMRRKTRAPRWSTSPGNDTVVTRGVDQVVLVRDETAALAAVAAPASATRRYVPLPALLAKD